MRVEDDEWPDVHALLGSLLRLMTGFARIRCPRQAVLIERQLNYLEHYPDHLASPVLKAVARRLRGEWQRVLFEMPRKDDPAQDARISQTQTSVH
ncbi:MAG: hypothetical protein AB1697_01320 [Pseudomonadota bacterium]|jgi:hypothetical protein|nr:hypothetical protein [Rhodocyclaceae bacterium]